jgi:hypothetical protein
VFNLGGLFLMLIGLSFIMTGTSEFIEYLGFAMTVIGFFLFVYKSKARKKYVKKNTIQDR